MYDGTYRALYALNEHGSVPCSTLSARTTRRLQPLLDSGAIVRRRRGRGMIVEVTDPAALQAFARKLFPHGSGIRDDTGAIPPRGEAVALYRDAKRARTASAEPVLIRALAPAKASRREAEADLYAMTQATRAACLLIDDQVVWRLATRIAVVENMEVFLHFERLQTGWPVVLYAGGRLSHRVLDWLASPTMAPCIFLHCGDYDPVGLDEYLRLRKRLEERVSLHIPKDIDTLFARYGKRELLRDSADILVRLRSDSAPTIRRLVEIMDTTGCGLEQEALLLQTTL